MNQQNDVVRRQDTHMAETTVITVTDSEFEPVAVHVALQSGATAQEVISADVVMNEVAASTQRAGRSQVLKLLNHGITKFE